MEHLKKMKETYSSSSTAQCWWSEVEVTFLPL